MVLNPKDLVLLYIPFIPFIPVNMSSSHNPQSQVRRDEKSENADFVKSHTSVVDGIKLLSLDMVKLAVHLVDPVMG